MNYGILIVSGASNRNANGRLYRETFFAELDRAGQKANRLMNEFCGVIYRPVELTRQMCDAYRKDHKHRFIELI